VWSSVYDSYREDVVWETYRCIEGKTFVLWVVIAFEICMTSLKFFFNIQI